MKTIISHQSHQTFEDIKQIDSNGVEFWYARALAEVVEGGSGVANPYPSFRLSRYA